MRVIRRAVAGSRQAAAAPRSAPRGWPAARLASASTGLVVPGRSRAAMASNARVEHLRSPARPRPRRPARSARRGAKAGSSVGRASTACMLAELPADRGGERHDSRRMSSPGASRRGLAARRGVEGAVEPGRGSRSRHRPGCARRPARRPAHGARRLRSMRSPRPAAPAHWRSPAPSDSGPSRPRDARRSRCGGRSSASRASSTISELFDCSAVSHMTGASAGLRSTSTLSGIGSKTIWPSGVSMRCAAGQRRQHAAREDGSEKASVSRPTRRPRRTRASASCERQRRRRLVLPARSTSGSSQRCGRRRRVLTSISASSRSRSPPSGAR